MSLVADLYVELEKAGISKESICESKENGYTMIAFNEFGGLNIMFAIVDDNNRVEVYVRKQIKMQANTLEKVNDLNTNYSGVTFFVDKPNILSIKTLCFTDGDIKCALANMLDCLDAAKEELSKF